MAESVKHHLKAALTLLLKPLVRLLIAQGVTHADFSETAKEVYVEIALRHFDAEGKVNKSRVAILTGLTRKEVKNVVDRTLEIGNKARMFSRPERVLTGWYSDPKYTGPYGIPLELPYESSDLDDPSFVKLVRAYSGDMAPRQMLTELLSSGSVVELDQRYKAIRRNYEPAPLSPEIISRLGDIGYWVFSTIAKNMEKEKRQDFGLFERVVFADDGCTDDVIEKFDEYVKVRGQKLIEEIDVWFATNEHANDPNQQRKDTGFYMVHYVDNKEERSGLREILLERGVDID